VGTRRCANGKRAQLARDFLRGAGHAGQPDVAPKEFLVADADQCFLPHREYDALFDLDHLVQSALPRSVRHNAAVYSSTIWMLLSAPDSACRACKATEQTGP